MYLVNGSLRKCYVSKKEQQYRYADSADGNDNIVTIRFCIRVKSNDLKIDDLIEDSPSEHLV